MNGPLTILIPYDCHNAEHYCANNVEFIQLLFVCKAAWCYRYASLIKYSAFSHLLRELFVDLTVLCPTMLTSY